jgi:hypothetical protein
LLTLPFLLLNLWRTFADLFLVFNHLDSFFVIFLLHFCKLFPLFCVFLLNVLFNWFSEFLEFFPFLSKFGSYYRRKFCYFFSFGSDFRSTFKNLGNDCFMVQHLTSQKRCLRQNQ